MVKCTRSARPAAKTKRVVYRLCKTEAERGSGKDTETWARYVHKKVAKKWSLAKMVREFDGSLPEDFEKIFKKELRNADSDSEESDSDDDYGGYGDDDSEDEYRDLRKNAAGTFNEHIFRPKKDKTQPQRIRNPALKKVSEKKIKFFETEDNKAIHPTAFRVFQRLHRNERWMKDPKVCKENYKTWLAGLQSAHGSRAAVDKKLKKIIAENHLNPSERAQYLSGGAVAGEGTRRCEGAACLWDGKKCVVPDAEDYFDLKFPRTKQDSMNVFEAARKRALLGKKFEALDNKCAPFRSRNYDMEY